MSAVKTHAMKFSKICSKNERKKKRSVPQLPDLCLWVHCGAVCIMVWIGQDSLRKGRAQSCVILMTAPVLSAADRAALWVSVPGQ